MTRIALLIVLGLTAGFNSVNAQYHRCFSHQAEEYKKATIPGYREAVENAFLKAQQLAAPSFKTNGAIDTVFYIQTVFHVVSDPSIPESDLSDELILGQLERMNLDYRRMNEDTTNTRAEFLPIAADARIQFVLPTEAPDGSPSNGIVRVSSTHGTFFDAIGLFTGDMSGFDEVKNDATGGSSPWPTDRYLNIWVCDMSIPIVGPAILGYAYPPTGASSWPSDNFMDSAVQGVVIQFEAVGPDNPSMIDPSVGQGRTVVHEVGHYLGLRHIWGDGDCTQDDGIDDTPDADDASAQDCDLGRNTCTESPDLPDMVENYMDYSSELCQNSFTHGQVHIMRSMLLTTRSELPELDFVFPLSIEQEPFKSLSVSINPNPVAQYAVVSTSGPLKNAAIEIYDLTGRRLFLQEMSGSGLRLDLSDFEQGIYAIRINQGGTTIEKSFIKL